MQTKRSARLHHKGGGKCNLYYRSYSAVDGAGGEFRSDKHVSQTIVVIVLNHNARCRTLVRGLEKKFPHIAVAEGRFPRARVGELPQEHTAKNDGSLLDGYGYRDEDDTSAPPWAIAYSLTGPVADLAAIVRLLRSFRVPSPESRGRHNNHRQRTDHAGFVPLLYDCEFRRLRVSHIGTGAGEEAAKLASKPRPSGPSPAPEGELARWKEARTLADYHV